MPAEEPEGRIAAVDRSGSGWRSALGEPACRPKLWLISLQPTHPLRSRRPRARIHRVKPANRRRLVGENAAQPSLSDRLIMVFAFYLQETEIGIAQCCNKTVIKC